MTCFQVQFVDETKLTLVQAKDFFLHTFDDLFAPDFGMFMYDDTKTLVWFPSKVNYFPFLTTESRLPCTLLYSSLSVDLFSS